MVQMLDDFVDVTKDEKQIMHLWNSFVRKQRSVYIIVLFKNLVVGSICWGTIQQKVVDKHILSY